MAQNVIWVFDTSSIIEIRRSVENAQKPVVFRSMSSLVVAKRLVFPIQVVKELEGTGEIRRYEAARCAISMGKITRGNGENTVAFVRTGQGCSLNGSGRT